MATSGLAPLRGAGRTDDFSGGLRRLRPPATLLQPFGLRTKSESRLDHCCRLALAVCFLPSAYRLLLSLAQSFSSVLNNRAPFFNGLVAA